MKKFQIPPLDFNSKKLEFITFNVGEGAFHWIRDSSCKEHVGCIYDCGTRSGKRLINTSLRSFFQTIGTRQTLPLLMVSHYHVDHHSHLSKLTPPPLHRELDVKEIWLPEIDPYSMALYLRILAFANFFKYNNSTIADKELTRIFSRQGHLKAQLSDSFPGTKVTLAKKGDERKLASSESEITIKALTPPAFPVGKDHPLAETAAMASFMLSDREFISALKDVIRSIVSDNKPSGIELSLDFDEQILIALQHPPLYRDISDVNQYQDPDDSILRTWLAFCSSVSNKEVSRLSLSKADNKVPLRLRSLLLNLPQKIHDATHLFNLAVQVSDGESSYLLTGDADVRLWPTILSGCVNYHAVQVAHHGSQDNVDFSAFDKVRSAAYIVSAGKYKNWKHPSMELGLAVSGGNKGVERLYCTNVHDNCGIKEPGKDCRTGEVVDAISVTGDKVEWIIKGRRRPSSNCPNV